LLPIALRGLRGDDVATEVRERDLESGYGEARD
jgi:hypothetical protein